jgi:hypothetical protein
MTKVRPFAATVTYRDSNGAQQEEHVPLVAEDYEAAKALALRYVLEVLKLEDFELRVAGG